MTTETKVLPVSLVTDKQITISPQWSVHDDDGFLDATLIEKALRKQFPTVASIECRDDDGDLSVKIIERLSFDSPLLHFLVWEAPETDSVGLSRIDPSTGRVLQ